MFTHDVNAHIRVACFITVKKKKNESSEYNVQYVI